ncbi:electron transporter YccM [Citrobacter amalonaticus]|uniref:Electron transporter YccM n=1 Tax=Citrobacter amalonaticus TaxID=35703 RepID=A0A2S4RYA9_CITAM|nr:4Fe-4S binding protein [Citrobacter amalonaticus]POT57817.1 electron transporter YccM [Citrobacter amalonaticus]POT76656.1 electron transporter YccM [Citrobacter amalonaticus]POU65735.1 electron transporter YccM [Citrobacter amalonaticus]POV05892.1 electron transporter YccM [Citrobacter amalonaticus]
MTEKVRTRWQRRPGTTGGKRPWNDWRNASTWRKATQLLLLAINIYIGVTFYYWVRYCESGGATLFVPRPGGIEGWLPIAGLMNIRYTLETGVLPPIHAASMLLLVAFIVISLLLKKSFCSWLCPVGTISELTGNLGKKGFGRQVTLPRWLDIPMRGLKYLLLSFFLYIALSMPATGIQYFLTSAYGIIIDVKMLAFFRHPGSVTLASVAILVVISLFVHNAWCRYLCPYGALLGLFSLLSPVKIRRNADSCIDCGKCAKNCPSRIPVDKLIQVRTVECTGCMTCVESCPVASTLTFSLHTPPGNTDKRQSALSGMMMTVLLLGIVFAAVGFAVYAGVWESPVPENLYFRIIPQAGMIGH